MPRAMRRRPRPPRCKFAADSFINAQAATFHFFAFHYAFTFTPLSLNIFEINAIYFRYYAFIFAIIFSPPDIFQYLILIFGRRYARSALMPATLEPAFMPDAIATLFAITPDAATLYLPAATLRHFLAQMPDACG